MVRSGNRFWAFWASLAALLPAAPAARGASILEYSQDGRHFGPLAVVSGRTSAIRYYDLYDGDGHPAFGLLAGASTTCLYWDASSKDLALIQICGAPTIDAGWADLHLAGLPASTRVALTQDSATLNLDPAAGTAAAQMDYVHETSGLVLDDLGKVPFNIKLDLSTPRQMGNWRLTDGAGSFATLDASMPLYLRSDAAYDDLGAEGRTRQPRHADAPLPAGSVPEPSALAAAAAAAILLRRRPSRPAR